MAEQPNPSRQGKLLVVEDEAELRFILAANLRAAGFEVIEAEDGNQAIERALNEQPDVIIMDIGLPGLDGLSVTRTLQLDPRTSGTPVIILTARSASEDVIRGLEAGAQEYILKPFDISELVARVQTVYRSGVARRQLDQLNADLEEEVDVKKRRLQSLYEFMRDLNHADSRNRILDLIVKCISRATAAKRVSLLLTDSTGEYLVCVRAIGIDPKLVESVRVQNTEGVTGQVFQSGQTLSAKTYGVDTRRSREYGSDSFVSAPLVSTALGTQDGVIGVVNATDRPGNRPFLDEDVDCIRSIADAGAIALDNVNRRERLQRSVRVLLRTVGHLAEYRDEETNEHLDRVTKMSRMLAEEVQHQSEYSPLVTDSFLDLLVQAAPMHDIGKVGIPDDILAKPGKLTHDEYAIMKTHTEIGRLVLSRAIDPTCPIPLLEMCIDIAHSHHERYDGAGYPRGLRGQDIPLSARIIALVDAYDAITSKRRYKDAKPHEEAVDIIRTDSGTHFDPVLVETFLRIHDRFRDVRATSATALAEPVAALS